MALLRAYDAWAAELHSGGGGAARRFAERHYLSANGMEELHGTRRTLAASLADPCLAAMLGSPDVAGRWPCFDAMLGRCPPKTPP